MKLVVCTSSISRNGGGLFFSVRNLTKSIVALGVDSVVIGLRDEHAAKDISKWTPLEIHACTRRGPSFFPISRSMLKLVLESKPSILHAHGIWLYPSIVDLKARHKTKTPYVVSPRGMLDPWALRNSAFTKKVAGWLFEKRHLHYAYCIHALCESEYHSIRDYGLTNPVAIIPNGIDMPRPCLKFQPQWANRVNTGRKVMLFLGRIHPKKGLLNLIQAWSEFKANNRNLAKEWVIVIAGWNQGGHEDELKRLVNERKLDQDVIFLGPVFDDNKCACLQNADAFILPSFSEGLPMSVLEAWSYKLPVIMTSECNIPEGFEAGAAIAIRPLADSITEGLGKLLSMSDADRERMGWNGRNLVASRFSWPKIAAQMIDVYKWCLGQGPKPDCVRLN